MRASQDAPTGKDSAWSFVQSEVFGRTFREGMLLVEQTANYLDGPGRESSKSLSRSAALSYAGASMRLTTQLMQIASWLLVLRAVREGDMTFADASEDKYRVTIRDNGDLDVLDVEVPSALASLIESSNQLYQRIARLDLELFSEPKSDVAATDAAAQQRALFAAFSSKQ